MSELDPRLARKAAELRRVFDQSFAAAPPDAVAQLEDLLAIRIGPDPYAIRIGEISGLFAGKAVTRMPNAVGEFLGIAGFRGVVVPVYDLRALLGYPARDVPRWMVVAAAAPIALAFDLFEGHLRVPREAIAAGEHPEHTRRHVAEILRTDATSVGPRADSVRPIVGVASIVEWIVKPAQ